MEEFLCLDYNGIHEYQQNSYPYLMIDYAEKIIPGKNAKGYKNLTANDWFFKCHFPGQPSMPGMLQVEAIVQMFALSILTLPGNKGKALFVSSANNIKWARRVMPGDRFDIETTLLSWKRGVGKGKGIGSVHGEMACTAEFIVVMPEELEKYTKRSNL